MFGKAKPKKCKVIFVVPESLVPNYKAQKFEGKVGKKTIDMSPHFEQWVMGMPE